MRFRVFSLLVAGGLLSSAFGDATFSQSNWPGGSFNLSFFGTNATGGALANIAAGGNPGSYVELDASHSGGAFQMWTTVTVDAWVYDPSVSGEIDSIDFSGDVMRGTTSPPDLFQALIEQSGKFYAAFGSQSSASGWFNSSNTGATAGSFALLNSDGSFNFFSNPDFSSTGGAITFGYTFGVNGGGTDGTEQQFYDNINYHVHTRVLTPEPITMSLGLAGIGLFVRRRAKKA